MMLLLPKHLYAKVYLWPMDLPKALLLCRPGWGNETQVAHPWECGQDAHKGSWQPSSPLTGPKAFQSLPKQRWQSKQTDTTARKTDMTVLTVRGFDGPS